MQSLLDCLGNPRSAEFPAIDIAGDEGKGSTAHHRGSSCFGSGIGRAAASACSTSPHLTRFEERHASQNGVRPLPETSSHWCVKSPRRPTRWRRGGTLRSTPHLFRSDHRHGLAVLPAGRRRAGQSWRSASAGKVGCDEHLLPGRHGHHQHQPRSHATPGNTLAEIAREKAGIIKPHVRSYPASLTSLPPVSSRDAPTVPAPAVTCRWARFFPRTLRGRRDSVAAASGFARNPHTLGASTRRYCKSRSSAGIKSSIRALALAAEPRHAGRKCPDGIFQTLIGITTALGSGGVH